jgi:hypothetical protein
MRRRWQRHVVVVYTVGKKFSHDPGRSGSLFTWRVTVSPVRNELARHSSCGQYVSSSGIGREVRSASDSSDGNSAGLSAITYLASAGLILIGSPPGCRCWGGGQPGGVAPPAAAGRSTRWGDYTGCSPPQSRVGRRRTRNQSQRCWDGGPAARGGSRARTVTLRLPAELSHPAIRVARTHRALIVCRMRVNTPTDCGALVGDRGDATAASGQ